MMVLVSSTCQEDGCAEVFELLGGGLHMHDDETLDLFLVLGWVMLLIERESDADAVRSIVRRSKDRFVMVMRGGICFG